MRSRGRDQFAGVFGGVQAVVEQAQLNPRSLTGRFLLEESLGCYSQDDGVRLAVLPVCMRLCTLLDVDCRP